MIEKLFLSALCLAGLGCNVTEADARPWQSVNGFEFRRIDDRQRNDVADFLEIQFWKMEIKCPPHVKSPISLDLVDKSGSKNILRLTNGGKELPSHGVLTVGLQPVQGSQNDAEKIKLFIRLSYNSTSLSKGTVVTNPFAGKVANYGELDSSDGHIVLVVAGEHSASSDIKENDVNLVVNLKAN